MESSDIDKGISDVMARTLNLDSPPRRDSRDCTSRPTDNGKGMENGHHGHSSGKLQSESSKQKGENDTINVDLSDPDNVIQLLETVDLSEEDTEVLLQEAYSMNKKLKEMLRRQEQGSATGNRNVKHRTVEGNSLSKSSSGSVSGSRSGSAIASRNPLPPIKKEQTSIYAVKLKRSRTTVQDASPSRDFPVQRSKTKDVIGITRKPGARAKTTEPRPDWNDRFNYT